MKNGAQSCRVLQRIIHTIKITGKQKLKSLWRVSWEYLSNWLSWVEKSTSKVVKSEITGIRWCPEWNTQNHSIHKVWSSTTKHSQFHFNILPKSQLNGKKRSCSHSQRKTAKSSWIQTYHSAQYCFQIARDHYMG